MLLCIAATQYNVRHSNRILGQVVGYTQGEIPPESCFVHTVNHSHIVGNGLLDTVVNSA